jgi:hypothetical protein
MSDRNSREIVITTERDLLRRLCESGVERISPDSLQSLAVYSWSSPDHRVVFDALVHLAGIPRAALRDLLPAETTRMGFPDIAWDRFFSPPESTPDSHRATGELIEALLSASKRKS